MFWQLVDIPPNANVAQQEVFGPIMCVFKVSGSGAQADDEAVRLANGCGFGLSSCAFANDANRARNLASRLRAGMSAVNDLEGTTYLSQSLPFGGVGLSGFDRFAGPEGLRGLTLVRSICEDKFDSVRTSIPKALQYPSKGHGPSFAMGLIEMFYSHSLQGMLKGLVNLMQAASK